MYQNKRHLCLQEMAHKKEVADRLEKKIAELEIPASSPGRKKRESPCPCFHFLAVHAAAEIFSMKEVEMNHRYIWKGTLSCSCGYQAEIRHGILMTPNKNQNLQGRSGSHPGII